MISQTANSILSADLWKGANSLLKVRGTQQHHSVLAFQHCFTSHSDCQTHRACLVVLSALSVFPPNFSHLYGKITVSFKREFLLVSFLFSFVCTIIIIIIILNHTKSSTNSNLSALITNSQWQANQPASTQSLSRTLQWHNSHHFQSL